MRWFIGALCFLLAYFCYQELFKDKDEALGQEEFVSLLKGDTTESQNLRSSFQKILPKLGNRPTSSDTQETHAFNPADGEAHFRSLLDTDEDEAMVYLRRILLHSSYPVDDKIEFFQSAVTQLPKEEVSTMIRLILSGNIEPELFREALKMQLGLLEASEAETFLRELNQRTYDRSLKPVILEESRARGYEL